MLFNLVRRLLFEFCIEGATDKRSSDFAGSCANFIEFGIAQQSSGGIIVDVAVTFVETLVSVGNS
jgi:hypothetical protein